MLNDWAETPGGLALRAALGTGDGLDGAFPAGIAAIGTDQDHDVAAPTAPTAQVSPRPAVDGRTLSPQPDSISETDIRFWFG